MNSLQSQLVLFLLKHRHWFRLKLKREPVDWNTSIPALRERAEKSTGIFGKLPPGIAALPVTINGLSAEWVRPVGTSDDRAILYFHGGGYVMGSCRTHRAVVGKFVAGSQIGALIFDYRLAPEHPFPAALDDSIAAYTWLLAQGFSPARIVFAGDSAGGGLCLATLLALRDTGIELPAAAVVLSPWTDLKCTGNSYQRPDPLAPEGSWSVFSSYYVGQNDPAHPLISPLYGDLAGLPPLLLYVGEEESMLDDATQFAEKARTAGVTVRIHIGKGMVHCYPALSPLFPEASEAMDDICRFLHSSVLKDSGTENS
ncbi:MAG: alpha/beta hydrolase [Acidobacteria bacterium]|nr:alpha/beta hydrolase [Acidobacteriota bacterium]